MNDYTKTYKPKTLAEYHCDAELKDVIEKYIANDMRKPIIFYGPAGTGKTTLAEIIGNELNANVHSLNCSIDNGIGIVREKIVPWASQGGFDTRLNVIILDEAERMTPQAQDALKRTIDDHSGICIFILCTNNLNKIILPIQSRAGKDKNTDGFVLKLAGTSDKVIRELLVDVSERAGLVMTEDIEAIVDAAHGNPRAAVNALQAYAIDTFKAPESKHDAYENVLNSMIDGKSPLSVVHLITEDDLSEFAKFCMNHDGIDLGIIRIIADTDKAMQHSVNKDIHLIDMLLKIREL
jgi:replication factor C small subunit